MSTKTIQVQGAGREIIDDCSITLIKFIIKLINCEHSEDASVNCSWANVIINIAERCKMDLPKQCIFERDVQSYCLTTINIKL